MTTKLNIGGWELEMTSRATHDGTIWFGVANKGGVRFFTPKKKFSSMEELVSAFQAGLRKLDYGSEPEVGSKT